MTAGSTQAMSDIAHKRMKNTVISLKGAITLKPPIIFHIMSVKYDLSWMTCPPKLWLVETAIWWGSSSLILLAGSRQWWEESRLDHCWGNFGARLLQRPVHGPWALSVVRGHEDKTYDICPSPWKSPGGRLMLRATGSWDLGRDLGQPMRSPRGRLMLRATGSLDLGV